MRLNDIYLMGDKNNPFAMPVGTTNGTGSQRDSPLD
jgi:hypothetical protein